MPRAESSWHSRAQTRRLSLQTGRRVKFIVSGKSNAHLLMPASPRPKLLDDTLGAKLLVVGTYLIFNPWWTLFAAQLPVYFVEIHSSELNPLLCRLNPAWCQKHLTEVKNSRVELRGSCGHMERQARSKLNLGEMGALKPQVPACNTQQHLCSCNICQQSRRR